MISNSNLAFNLRNDKVAISANELVIKITATIIKTAGVTLGVIEVNIPKANKKLNKMQMTLKTISLLFLLMKKANDLLIIIDKTYKPETIKNKR